MKSSHIKAKNFFGLDLVSRQTADDIYYYLFNSHGDVTHLLNEKGDILKDYRYDPFGKDVQEPLQLTPGKTTISLWRNEVEKLDNPFRYAGEYFDQETGYYYLRARYYDPQIQRFISEDSYAKSPTWDEHIYAYAEYNPVNLVDPTGHDAGNAGRDYSKRIVNKPTKTTAKNAKKSSSKINTVAKVQAAVGNQAKTQVKSVTQRTREIKPNPLPSGTIDLGKAVGGFLGNINNKYVAPVLDKYLAKPVVKAVGPVKTPGQVAAATGKIVVGSFVAAGAKALIGFEVATGGAASIQTTILASKYPTGAQMVTGATLSTASKAMEDYYSGKHPQLEEYLLAAGQGAVVNLAKGRIPSSSPLAFLRPEPLRATDPNFEVYKAYLQSQNPSIPTQILLQLK